MSGGLRGARRAGPAAVLALSALTAVAAMAPPAVASPASLDHALKSFGGSTEATGLRYGVVFAPVRPTGNPTRPGTEAAPPAEVRAHADVALVPASVAKLPTTLFALEDLGTDFTFTTRILAAGAMDRDTLRGDLILEGGGDPFLVSERVWMLAREVRAAGVARVTGRLIVDGRWLAPDSTDPVRSRDREVSDRPYAARLSGLAVNFNAAALRIVPGSAPGSPVLVEPDPLPCSYLAIDNRLVTGATGSPEQLTIRLEWSPSGVEVAHLEGSLPAGAPARVEYRSVADPLSFSAAMIRSFLEQEGIRIDGPTAPGTAGSEARLLVAFPSLPLKELAAKANRYSNNFMADQIALALSRLGPRALPETAPGASLTRAGQVITARLRADCGAPESVLQVDGCGLSPADRLTAGTLASVLQRGWNDLRVGPDFAASLAVPGQDGTLRNRFKGGALPALRGKTGTMSDPLASAIAGYLESDRGTVVAFTILMNAPANAGWDLARMKALQETWIREYLR